MTNPGKSSVPLGGALPLRRWDLLHRACFKYFEDEVNPDNGLVADKATPDSPCSIAVTGFALSSYPIGVERGWIKRAEAARLTVAALRFFANQAEHHEGFFFHFLDMETGGRVWKCEVSSIDSALLFYGILVSGAYFDLDTAVEREIRELATLIVERADWKAWQDGGNGVCLWWKPEHGFTRYRWSGFSEGLLVYLLGLGSETHPLPVSSFNHYRESFRHLTTYGIEWVYCGPLFTHIFPHLWFDFRLTKDHLDLWENTRRAIHIQREYATRNPKNYPGYGPSAWGLSACDGPGESREAGVRRYAYRARGAPRGPDDGTLSPPVVLASLPFEPQLAIEAEAHFHREAPDLWQSHGMRGAWNPGLNWKCTPCFGLDQGMLVLMLENARSGFLWQLSTKVPHFQRGLTRAGFLPL